MRGQRNVFIVVAGGNLAAERHFEDTIQRKRKVDEVREFLPANEVENLQSVYHGSPFIVWGAVPGKLNETRWHAMTPGDVVLIYNKERIRFVGEVAAKVRSRELARHFWKETEGGDTWELIYFIVNERPVDVLLSKLNPLFGYKENYTPQGLTMINEKAVAAFARHYGDVLGVLETLQRGNEPHQLPESVAVPEVVEEEIERAPTEHDEMQWRLIRLGHLARCDIWVPRNDQGHSFENHLFREYVLSDFHEVLDVPTPIKNIDVVWRFGPYSIKAAFEIEHSTSVYSGVLRLSDLRALSPNSTYPLLIVAPGKRRKKFMDELRRPTFQAECLRLQDVVKFLAYDDVREIDEKLTESDEFDTAMLFSRASGLVEK